MNPESPFSTMPNNMCEWPLCSAAKWTEQDCENVNQTFVQSRLPKHNTTFGMDLYLAVVPKNMSRYKCPVNNIGENFRQLTFIFHNTLYHHWNDFFIRIVLPLQKGNEFMTNCWPSKSVTLRTKPSSVLSNTSSSGNLDGSRMCVD